MGITLHCGDCLEIMKTIPDKSIGLVLTDPPYGTTACKWDTIIPFEPLWEQYKRIIKDNGAIVLTASQPFTSALVMSNIKMFKYEWVWKKNTGSGICSAKYQPMKYHENVIVFATGKTIYNPQPTLRTAGSAKRCKSVIIGGSPNSEHIALKNKVIKYNPDNKNPESVLIINTEPNSLGKLHPTQKPVALFEYLIKTYTNEGDLVLDNCAGSGTTGVACKNLNRNCILIEKDETYFKIAERRINQTMENLL